MKQPGPSRSINQGPTGSGRILVMLGALYLSQGLPIGLGFVALPVILRSQGASLEMIGLLGLLLVPWAMKFLWAPWVDRLDGGRWGARRSWILPLQWALAALLVGMALLPQDQGIGLWMLGLLFVANVLSATQDIATDGLAIEVLQDRALGWANALQIGGFSLGMMLGGSLAVMVYESGGQAMTFMLLGLLVLASSLPVLLYGELPRAAGCNARHRASLPRMLARPGAGLAMLIAAGFFFATTMKGGMLGPLLVDAGLSMTQIGTIHGSGTLFMALVSAPLGSVLVQRYGAQRTGWVAGMLGAASIALWLWPASAGQIGFAAALGIELVNSIMAGVAYVAFFTLFMQWASRDQAGTDFTVLQCTEQVSNVFAGMLAGTLAGALGHAGFFACTAVIGFALMLAIGVALGRLSLHGATPDAPLPAMEDRHA